MQRDCVLFAIVLALQVFPQASSAQTNIISTFAGAGAPSDDVVDGIPAIQASLEGPTSVAVDTAGNVYIADHYHQRVRVVDSNGIIHSVAGGGSPADGIGDGLTALAAAFSDVEYAALDASHNVLISDLTAGRVRRVVSNNLIMTIAGGGAPADGVGDGLPAPAAALRGPASVAVNPATGDIYIAEFYGGRVRRVDTYGKISTFAGGGAPSDGIGDGLLATQAALIGPAGIAVGQNGDIYISDNLADRVRRVDSSGTITTVVGGGSPADGLGDGRGGTQAALSGPAFIALDAAGNLFIPDLSHRRVRRWNPVTNVVTTVAGGGTPADGRGDGLPATQAAFLSPVGVAFDSAGTLFIADGEDYRVRKVPGVGMTPSQSLTADLTYEITAFVPLGPAQTKLLSFVQTLSSLSPGQTKTAIKTVNQLISAVDQSFNSGTITR